MKAKEHSKMVKSGGGHFIVLILVFCLFTTLTLPPAYSSPSNGRTFFIAVYTPKWSNDLVQLLFNKTNDGQSYIMDLSLSPSHNIFLTLQNAKKVIGAASLSGLSAAINRSNVKPDIVAYDIEHWQNTPIAEQNDPVTAISKAADIVHGAGYQFAVTPDRKFLLSYYNKIDWTKVDVLGMQIQRELSNMSKYVSDANTVASFVKSVNPNTVVLSQVSFLVSDPNQIIQAVDNVRNSVDGFIIVYNSASTESPYSTVGNMDKVISHIIKLGQVPEFPISAVPIAILGTFMGLLLFLARWKALAG